MPRLSEDQRNQAIGMLRAGVSVALVSRAFGCSRQTIFSLRNRYLQTGRVQDRQRSGRPRVTTRRRDNYIRLTHLRRRFLPATDTARALGITAQTVRNRLREANPPIQARRPYTGQVLTARHRVARLNWARQHRIFRRQDWRRVLFSDECRFNLSHADGRERVYRRNGERFVDVCVRERDRFGGGSIMVWGGIMGQMKTRLIFINGNLNAQRYVNQVLAAEAIPFLQRHGPATLQQDNARPHTAAVTRNHLAANNINVLDWPALSPDMNPIEHIWDELGRRVRENHQFNDINGLRAAIIQEWNNIPNAFVLRYVNSMQSRIRALLAANGGHTRY